MWGYKGYYQSYKDSQKAWKKYSPYVKKAGNFLYNQYATKPYSLKKPKYSKTAKQLAVQNAMMIHQINKGIEKKTIDTNDTITIPIGGAWIDGQVGPYCIKGPDSNDRLGEKIKLISMSIRFGIVLSALEALGTKVRVIICMDNRNEGALTASSYLMEDDNDIYSQYQSQKKDYWRFKVLMDKTYCFDTVTTRRYQKGFFKLNKEVLYNAGNAGTVADVDNGNIAIFAMAAGNAATINVTYRCKFKYSDM